MPLSEDDKAEIAKLVADAVASATKSQAESITGLVQRSVAAAVDAAVSKPAPAADPADGKDKAGKDKPDIAGLLDSHLKPLREQLEAERKARLTAEAERRNSEAATVLQNKLTAAGIRPELIPTLINDFKARGLLVDDPEANQVGWSATDALGQKAVIPLDLGIEGWAKSPDADVFRPPKGLRGSGVNGGRPDLGGRTGTIDSARGVAADLFGI